MSLYIWLCKGPCGPNLGTIIVCLVVVGYLVMVSVRIARSLVYVDVAIVFIWNVYPLCSLSNLRRRGRG